MCFGGSVSMPPPPVPRPPVMRRNTVLEPLRGDDNFVGTDPVYESAAKRSQPRAVMTQTPSLLMRRL